MFGSEIVRKRGDELKRIASETIKRLSSVTKTTDSVHGVVLENNSLLKRVAAESSDDVASARSVINERGVKSDVPGVTSSLFNNTGSYGGNLPALNAMLKKVKNRSSDRADTLLLGLEKILPNEFVNFPKITALTFPDKFPVPISEHHFMGTSMMNASVRQHLLDHYDGRFSDIDLIFWWYSVLSRHCTIRNTSAFFKKNSDAKRRFENLCNQDDLEEKLKHAMRNSTSPEAKLLNKEFLSLINVLGGYTPWSTAERQRTLGKLYAMSNFMGPPSFFFTIAPCIADSEICLKFLNFLTFRYKIRQSTHEQRSIWSAQHPLSSSKAFHTIMEALVNTFIGIPTGNTKYSVPVDCMVHNDNNDHGSISARFEAHLRSRSRCFGVPTAFYGIYEAQGRGALHMHALI